MNDFTKEELEHLSTCISLTLSNGYFPFGETGNDLYKKIQSIIDNYCDHESEPYPQEICCIKCQRTLG